MQLIFKIDIRILELQIDRVIVEKKNEKTFFSLPTCGKGNPPKKIPFSHGGRKIEIFLFPQWKVRKESLPFSQKITDFTHFSRSKFIFFWFFFMWKGKFKKSSFLFTCGKGNWKKFFSRNTKCGIPHLFPSLRDHSANRYEIKLKITC